MYRAAISVLLAHVVAVSTLAAQESSLRSPRTEAQVRVTWKNNTSRAIDLRWVNFDGQRVGLDGTPEGRPHSIASEEEFTGNTYVGHVFYFDGKTYMVPDSGAVAPPFSDHVAEQRIEINVASRARDTRYRFDWLRSINDSLRVRYECLNREAGGYGSAWKKVRRENGESQTTYFTEIARTPDYVMLREPVTKHTVILWQRGRESGIDEVAPGEKTWMQTPGGNWYAPK